MIVSLVTLLVYTTISFRLAYTKRLMNDKDMKCSRNEAESPGWFSKWFPHVSKLAWSTLDLTNLYVKIPLLFNLKIFT